MQEEKILMFINVRVIGWYYWFIYVFFTSLL